MCSGLVEAVDALDLQAKIALRDRVSASIAADVIALDASQGWALDGATSITAWLRTDARMSAADAASMVKTARRMRDLPVTFAAWADGTLSAGQVQAVVANVDDKTVAMLAAQETDLVPVLAALDVTDTASTMRFWKARADLLVDRDEPVDKPNRLHLSPMLDGRRRIDGELDVESGAIVDTGLRLAMTDDAAGETRTPAEKRADALVDVFRFFLDHQQQTPAGIRHRPHLNIVIGIDDLENQLGGDLIGYGPLTPTTIQRICCDAEYHRVITNGASVILDYGTSTRIIAPALFNAVVLRDQHCRHHGCDRPPQWCEAHHVIPVKPRRSGDPPGPTVTTNLVLKCSRHHHLGHKPGWSETLEPDGILHLTAPDGRTFTTHPPGVLPHLATIAA